MASWKGARVIVTGGAGFLGQHLVALLRERGCEPFVPRSEDYDLRTRRGIVYMFTDAWFWYDKHTGLNAGPIDVLFHLAAHTGGIGLNQERPAELFYNNAIMGVQLIEEARAQCVRKFVQVGTVCSYPKHAASMHSMGFNERTLWNGYPEETNAAYGLAKKMLLVQLQAYRQQYGFNGIYVIPTNLYGPFDSFDSKDSHVIPALIRKCVEAREANRPSIKVWGTGKATRDFLYVKDCAEALLIAAECRDTSEPVNIASGEDISIMGLVGLVKELTGYEGKVEWKVDKPDGQPRRLLDISLARHDLGWHPKTSLEEGLRETVEWFEKARIDEAIGVLEHMIEEGQARGPFVTDPKYDEMTEFPGLDEFTKDIAKAKGIKTYPEERGPSV